MIRSFTILIPVTLVFAVSACEREPKPKSAAHVQAAVPSPLGQIPRPIDSIPAFQLELPVTWEGRSRVERADGAAADRIVPRAKRVIEYIYLPADSKLNEQSLLMLIVMAGPDWLAAAKEPGPPLGALLAEQGGYAYVAALPQSNPYAKDSEDARRFDQMHLDLNAIKAAFKLESP